VIDVDAFLARNTVKPLRTVFVADAVKKPKTVLVKNRFKKRIVLRAER